MPSRVPNTETELRFAVVPVAACVHGTAQAAAPEFPTRPIRILASEAGGGNDAAIRLIAQNLTASMGQPVIVENRGGGSLAGEAVAKSPADGHTLLYYGNTFWLLPLMRSNVGYDVERDFAPIVLATRQYSVLAVHPSLPVRSVKELIALARARPGELNYSSAATGTVNHLSAELFKSLAHINVVRISYKGIVSALNALMSGEVQLMFPGASSVTGHVRIGRVKALAITSPQPSPASRICRQWRVPGCRTTG